MRIRQFALTLLFAGTLTTIAHADPINTTGTGSGGGFTGSGTLTTTNNGDGSYSITGISGSGITGLVGSGAFNFNDNLLYPGGTLLVDSKGFAFTDTQGNTSFQVDIFSDASGSYYAYLLDSDGIVETVPVTFSVANAPAANNNRLRFFHQNSVSNSQNFTFTFQTPTVTPEPSSLVLLGTGLLGAFGAIRRRNSRARGTATDR